MKKILSLFLLWVCSLCCAQTFTVNNLVVNGTVSGTGIDAYIANHAIVQTVTNVAALRTTNCVVGLLYADQGYYTAGDGGSGRYVCTTDTTTPDNGGSVIAAANGQRLYLQVYDKVSVMQFGAKGDGTTDDTVSIQAAVSFAGQKLASNQWGNALTVANTLEVDFPSRVYIISGANGILVPPYVILSGHNSTIVGPGGTNAMTTAYWNAGVLTSNIGLAISAQRMQYTVIQNFNFRNFSIALNLQNFNEGSAVLQNNFNNVDRAWLSTYPYYSRYIGNTVRGTAGTNPAFDFEQFNNVIQVENNTAVGHAICMQLGGGTYGATVKGGSCEGGVKGLVVVGVTDALTVQGYYFENNSGTSLDFSDNSNAHTNVRITGNYFHVNTGTSIVGNQMLGGVVEDNFFDSNTGALVNISDNVSTITVKITPARIAPPDSSPALPAGYTFGLAVKVDYYRHMYNTGSGNTELVQNFAGSGIVPRQYSGDEGYAPGTIPFTTVTQSSGTTQVILTSIKFNPYIRWVYAFAIQDTVSTYTLNGHGYGSTVIMDTASGKTVTASNNGGFLQLSISTFTGLGTTDVYEGIIQLQ